MPNCCGTENYLRPRSGRPQKRGISARSTPVGVLAVIWLCQIFSTGCSEKAPQELVVRKQDGKTTVNYRRVSVTAGKVNDEQSGRELNPQDLKDDGLELFLEPNTAPYEFFRIQFPQLAQVVVRSFPIKIVTAESEPIEFVVADSTDVTEASEPNSSRIVPYGKFSIVRFGANDTFALESALRSDPNTDRNRRTACLAIHKALSIQNIRRAIVLLKDYGFERFTFSLVN